MSVAGAEAQRLFAVFAARLKSCPDTKRGGEFRRVPS